MMQRTRIGGVDRFFQGSSGYRFRGRFRVFLDGSCRSDGSNFSRSYFFVGESPGYVDYEMWLEHGMAELMARTYVSQHPKIQPELRRQQRIGTSHIRGKSR